MLKTRVVGVVPVRNGIAVQSVGFARYLPLGRPEVAIAYLDRWGIDEIIVLHIDGVPPGTGEVASYARHCRVPLSVGGGVRDAQTVRSIIHAGADKIVLNTAVLTHPGLVGEAARLFGDQCVVVSIDGRRGPRGHEAFVAGGAQATGLQVSELAARVAREGAGEILVNSIDRDGMKQGYDLDLVRSVVAAVGIPVIACGGVGQPEDLRAGFEAGAAALAAANFFHFTEHSVILAKSWLAARGVPVRLDSYTSYAGRELDGEGRLPRLAEETLDELRFRYVPEEVI